MFSIEFLFRECNIRQKTLGILLKKSILINNKESSEITLLEVGRNNLEKEQIAKSLFEGKNTNTGIYPVFVSDIKGNPLNQQVVNLQLENILEVWER